MIIARAVNFGATHTGLATVGYTLKNADGSINKSRTTSGITEIVAGKGAYAASIEFDDAFSGILIWDTGGGSPVYAYENVDYRSFLVGGGVVSMTGVWDNTEKERLFKLLNKFLKLLEKTATIDLLNKLSKQLEDSSNVRSLGVLRTIENVKKEFSVLESRISAVDASVKAIGGEVNDCSTGINAVGEMIDTIIEAKSSELDAQLKDLEEALDVEV